MISHAPYFTKLEFRSSSLVYMYVASAYSVRANVFSHPYLRSERQILAIVVVVVVGLYIYILVVVVSLLVFVVVVVLGVCVWGGGVVVVFLLFCLFFWWCSSQINKNEFNSASKLMYPANGDGLCH